MDFSALIRNHMTFRYIVYDDICSLQYAHETGYDPECMRGNHMEGVDKLHELANSYDDHRRELCKLIAEYNTPRGKSDDDDECEIDWDEWVIPEISQLLTEYVTLHLP